MPLVRVNPSLTTLVAPVPFWDSAGDGEDGWEGPDYASEAWDLCTLNGRKLPGISSVECTPRVRLQLPKATGRDGGPAINKGHEAARVDITVKFWTPSQFAILQGVLASIWRRPGAPALGDAKAVTIAHPACALYGVTAILIESPESPKPAPEAGARILRIKGLQYIPPKEAAVARVTRGSGRAQVIPEVRAARNGIPPKPSTTGALPKAPDPRPGGGT